MSNEISLPSTLSDLTVKLVVTEPYEAATERGAEPIFAIIKQFGKADDGGIYATLAFERSLSVEDKEFSGLLATPRHFGTKWTDLLDRGFLVVQLGTGHIDAGIPPTGSLPRAVPGVLVAVGHIRLSPTGKNSRLDSE